MYTKRLAENLVQKSLLLFEILSFEVYCRSDSDLTQRYAESATPRIVESGSRFSNTISENSCRLLRKKNLSGVAYYAKKFYTLSLKIVKHCRLLRLKFVSAVA